MSQRINVNRLLENSRRSDVHGYNIYTRGKKEIERPTDENFLLEQWDAPVPGLPGTVAIGHELDKKDVILPVVSVEGRALEFYAVRHRWTPAFTDTYYRSRSFGEYRRSGLIALRERKCFTENDTFVSHLTLFNDGREPITVSLAFSVPFEKTAEGRYLVEARILPRSLQKEMLLRGFAAVGTAKGETVTLTVPAQSNVSIAYGFAFSAKSEREAVAALHESLGVRDPFSEAEDRFNAWMEAHAPTLTCDDPDLLKVYYYRLFLIKTAIHTPADVLPESGFSGQCVYESPFGTWFGAPVGLPIPLQIEEMKWLKETVALRSHIANWSRKCGVTQAYIQFTPMAIWRLYLQTGDRTLVEKFYEAARAYTFKKCGPEGTELPVAEGSWGTGAEYQPSFYQHVTPKWDWRQDREGAKSGFPINKMYRLDECAMYVANLTACGRMASLLGRAKEAEALSLRAAAAADKLRDLCWDGEKQFFFDVDVASGKRSDEAYCYDGFLPLMYSMFGEEYHAVFDKLRAGERFDGGFGLTSVGKDCPMYWFDNCIAGPTASDLSQPHAYECCWNGPIWPFAMSLVLKALGEAAYVNETLVDVFLGLFAEYTELHFDLGDRSTPCICEHYRPTDAASFSPYTEYFHSEWLNLFFSYYLGIRVTEQGISFRPMTRESFTVDGVVIRGKTYRFSQECRDGELRTEAIETT